MSEQRRQFYDRLAADFHLAFADWQATIEDQGALYDALIHELLGPATWAVLDAASGIGTRALGLAMRGHRVSAADVSPGAVARLQREAEARRLRLRTAIADLPGLAVTVAGLFDVVLAADHSLALQLDQTELERALAACHGKLRPGGVLLAACHDYDRLVRDRPASWPPRFFGHLGQRRCVHQIWDWLDERCYQAHHYLSHDTDAGWRVQHQVLTCRAWLRAEITAALQAAGFRRIRWYAAEEDGEQRPIVVALRA
jgi:SAM-dependent methyltransferase